MRHLADVFLKSAQEEQPRCMTFLVGAQRAERCFGTTFFLALAWDFCLLYIQLQKYKVKENSFYS